MADLYMPDPAAAYAHMKTSDTHLLALFFHFRKDEQDETKVRGVQK